MNEHSHEHSHDDADTHTHSFDERAATWDDDPSMRERAERVANAIDNTLALRGDERVLEYGAGTGLVTQALGARVGHVTMADTSAGMREVMEQKIAAGAIANARVWSVDLATDPVPDEQFDLVVTVMAMHHIEALDRVLAAFAELLVSGGRLCIADLEHEDGSFHGDGFQGHHGFTRAELTSALEVAGFRDVEFQPCGSVDRGGFEYPMFLATCAKG